MKITELLIAEISDPMIIQRGRRYFNEGRVRLEQVEEDYVRASVRGSRLYEVEITKNDRGEIDTDCTCFYDWNGACKHVVATLLAAMAIVPSAQDQKSANSPGWLRSISSILSREPAEVSRPASNSSWRHAYALEITGPLRRMSALRIKILKNGRDGSASKMLRYDPYDSSRFDFTDRIILSKISQGFTNQIETYPHDPYRGSYAGTMYWNHDRTMNDLLTLLKEKETYVIGDTAEPRRRVFLREESAQLRMSITKESDSFILTPELSRGRAYMPIPPGIVVLCKKPLWILMGEEILRVEGATGDQFLSLQALKGPLVVPAGDRDRFVRDALPAIALQYKIQTDLDIMPTVDADPIMHLYLSEADGKLVVRMRFKYGQFEIWDRPGSEKHPAGQRAGVNYLTTGKELVKLILRPEMEERAVSLLRASPLKAMGEFETTEPGGNTVHKESAYTPSIPALKWLLTELPKFRDAGFEIYGEKSLMNFRLNQSAAKIAASVSSGIDWFDVALDVRFGGTEASFEAFLQAIERDEEFVLLADGSYGVLPQEGLKKFRRAFELNGRLKNPDNSKGLKISRAQIGLVDELLEEAETVSTDVEFERTRDLIKSFTKITPKPLPKGFHGKLRPYQKAGYDWLHFLLEFRFGGILADDMGLGKTVQTLAFLKKLYEKGEKLPTLIVVPTSVIFNWEEEARRFTPGLAVHCHRGLDRPREPELLNGSQLIVISYGTLRRDIGMLKDLEFLYVILDESQNIKNPSSVNAKAVRVLKARQRLALTGTPIENNLMELWSQMTFLNPGILGNADSFASSYAWPVERKGDEAAAASLRRLVYPFILRRTKELVAKDLPPKQESVVYCEMNTEQRTVYDHWREYYRRSVLKSIEELGIRRSKFKVLQGLMKLRQVCCHPALVDVKYRGLSGKLESFMEMLEDILSEGHKVLVFSQFVRMLKLLRGELDSRKISYEYLDGHTVNRRECVERFQADSKLRVFLISLRAGGTGLNLTAADYVIHYDPWWNPAVEMQATDRTHRIGQKKHVFAYKLITKDTIEEKVLLLQEKKKHLVSSVITTDSGFMKALTKEDVETLFS